MAGPRRAGSQHASWLIGAVGLISLIVSGAVQSQAEEPDGLSGRVVDPSGSGVASAKVWVIGGSWDEPQSVAEATTGDHGEFSFPGFWEKQDQKEDLSRSDRYYTLAAQHGQRIGWLTSVQRGHKTPVAIELVPTAEARGRVVDTEGKPIAAAEVAPAIFSRSSDPRSAVDYLRLIPALASPLATTTGNDGSFTLRGIPSGCKVQAVVRTRGFGAPRVAWDSRKEVTITLDGRLGRIEGRLVAPDGKELPHGLSVTLGRRTPPGDHAGGGFDLIYSRFLEIAGDGRFRFDELPPGRYGLSAWGEPSTGYAADPIPEVEVAPSAGVTSLNVPLKRLVTITGRIVDAQNGEGLSGVGISASHLVENYLRYADRAVSDAQGRYTVRVAPGKILIQPTGTPKTHLGINSQTCPQFDVVADSQWPDLKLPRAVALDGVALDEAGKPVAGAEVHLVRPNPIGFADGGPLIQTAPDGAFRLEQLDPGDTLPVRARTKEATTDGAVVIRPGKQTERLKLTIGRNLAARVHGVVADSSGRPLPRASVMLWWNRTYVSEKTGLSGIGSVLETYETDSSGRFASSALWPGDQYHVTVQAKGHGKAESPQITGRSGTDHDLGTFRLVGTGSRVAGVVVDSSGAPVAGATVFNRGDAPEAPSTRTDAGGKFALDGLFAGGKYVFARKEGYRFTGTRVEGDSDVTIKLLRVDEAPPPWKPLEPATAEEEKALAKRALTQLWVRYGKEPNKTGAFVCLLHMARIDPSLALQWSTQAGGRYNGRISQEAAEVLAETDADAALELLAAPGVGASHYQLQRLAERFAAKDPVKALKFAEEAAVQSRAIDQPDRAGAMAQAGALLVRLGRKEAGLAMVNEAAEAASRMGLENRQAYARGNVAGALAPFDLQRALALVEPMKTENDRDRYLGFIASALAETDPERALVLTEKIGDRSSLKQSVKVGIAYSLGKANRPDDAVRVIEGMKGHASEKYQCEGYAWLAVALAARDKARAASLIDRALALPADRPEEFQSWTYFGGGTGTAAWVAVCAKRAGYPDMAGVVARVLATRGSDRNRDPAMEAQSQTIAAAILALTDPGAARQILRDIEARSGLSASQLGRVADRQWLLAWALVDPEHAEELFEAELDALDGQREVDLQRTNLLKLAEVLAQPRRRREAFLREAIGATWYPEIEN